MQRHKLHKFSRPPLGTGPTVPQLSLAAQGAYSTALPLAAVFTDARPYPGQAGGSGSCTLHACPQCQWLAGARKRPPMAGRFLGSSCCRQLPSQGRWLQCWPASTHPGRGACTGRGWSEDLLLVGMRWLCPASACKSVSFEFAMSQSSLQF
jgi:hypothetical protein